jgi:proliferating cell nuclear antigen PCNA
MTCESTEVFDRHFQIPLMEIDADVMHIPDMEYQAEFAIPSVTFATLIDQLKMFGDTLQVECSEEKIQLCSESQETGKMSVDIPIDDVISFAIEEGKELKLSFSLSYLHNICMYSKLAKNVEVCLSTNYPIRLVYSLSDDDDSKFVFYLAPKIDD